MGRNKGKAAGFRQLPVFSFYFLRKVLKRTDFAVNYMIIT